MNKVILLRISIVVLVLLLVLMHVAMKVPFTVTAFTVIIPSLSLFLVLFLLSVLPLCEKLVLILFVIMAIILAYASIVFPMFIVILLLFLFLVLSGLLFGEKFALGVALGIVVLLAYVNVRIGWPWFVAIRIELKPWFPWEVPVGFAPPSLDGYVVINPATGQGWKGVRLRPLSSDKAGIFRLILRGAGSLEVRHGDISFTVKVPRGIGPDHVVAVSVAGRSVLALRARTEDYSSDCTLEESGLFLCGAQGYREVSDWLKVLGGNEVTRAEVARMHIRVSSDGSYRLVMDLPGEKKEMFYYVVLGDQPLVRAWEGRALCLSADGLSVSVWGVLKERFHEAEESVWTYFVLRGDTGEMSWEVPEEAIGEAFPVIGWRPFLGFDGTEILGEPSAHRTLSPSLRYIVRRGNQVSWRYVVVEEEWITSYIASYSDWHSSWTPDGVLVTRGEQFQH
jgi:hypothetical protein